MAIDQKQMLQAVYDAIFDALTTAPGGVGDGRPVEDRNRTFLSLALPGNPVDVAQFANAWSPTTPEGSVHAAENFSAFVDSIPTFSPNHNPSGNLVEQMYGEAVNANVTPTPTSPESRAAYERSFNLLYTDGTDYNDQGQPVTVKVPSPIYRNYSNKLNAYSAALLGYMTNYLQYDLSRPEDARRWSVLAPALQTPLDQAWNDFQAARPGVVRTAIDTLGQHEASSLAGIFSQARQTFEQTRRGSLTQPGLFWHWCEAFPGNWFAESAAANFAQLTLNSSRLRISESSRFTSWGAGGGVNFGLWRVGGGASSQSSQYDLSTETSNMRISFRLARIEIRRRWMNPSIYSLQGWSVAGRAAGAYSNGQHENNPGVFPLLPTSFIVARDIQISASWGSSDLHQASRSTSASASVGWGPFSLSGSYRNSSSTRTYHSSFDGTTITVPGIQVVGWISAVLPLSPPSGGPSAQPDASTIDGTVRRRNPYHDREGVDQGASDRQLADMLTRRMEAVRPAPLPAPEPAVPALAGSRWVSAEDSD